MKIIMQNRKCQSKISV